MEMVFDRELSLCASRDWWVQVVSVKCFGLFVARARAQSQSGVSDYGHLLLVGMATSCVVVVAVIATAACVLLARRHHHHHHDDSISLQRHHALCPHSCSLPPCHLGTSHATVCTNYINSDNSDSLIVDSRLRPTPVRNPDEYLVVAVIIVEQNLVGIGCCALAA